MQLVSLVPAEGSVVEGLEVLLVEVDGASVVSNRFVEVALLAIREAPVVVEVCLLRLDFYRS